MTQSELMTVMTSGMAHVSGGVRPRTFCFGIEASISSRPSHDGARHPIMMAKDDRARNRACPGTMGAVRLDVPRTGRDVLDAAGRGTGEGLHLAAQCRCDAISFLALVALTNALLGLAHLSLQQIFGWLFAPVAWSMVSPGTTRRSSGPARHRMALNEFVAYSQLARSRARSIRSRSRSARMRCALSPTSSSIGIQIGGIGALAPGRRHELARLGLRAMFRGRWPIS